MVEQLTLQTYSILLTGVGMIIALVYYTLTIRNQNRTRQAQLMMSLYEAYRSPEFRRNWGVMMDQEYTPTSTITGRSTEA